MPGGDIIQCLLTLANQWGRCSNSPYSLQGRQTIRANTYVFLWCFLTLDIMSTGQDGKHLGLKDCGVSPKGETKPLSLRLPKHHGPGPSPHLRPICKTDVPLDVGGESQYLRSNPPWSTPQPYI
jgi:hypothetical protein